MAGLAVGSRFLHRLIWPGSVVASWKLCRVAGSLLPGWQGKTGQP